MRGERRRENSSPRSEGFPGGNPLLVCDGLQGGGGRCSFPQRDIRDKRDKPIGFCPVRHAGGDEEKFQNVTQMSRMSTCFQRVSGCRGKSVTCPAEDKNVLPTKH
jgi:hypothetical protein